MTAIRQTAVVRADGAVEVRSPDLRPGETVEVIVLSEAPKQSSGDPYEWLKIAQEMKLEGPPDWSEKIEDYLEGGKSAPG
jgi:hypothetical protein